MGLSSQGQLTGLGVRWSGGSSRDGGCQVGAEEHFISGVQ